jgi:hypothetical protein
MRKHETAAQAFSRIRRTYPEARADRIIAFMLNGMYESSAVAATA